MKYRPRHAEEKLRKLARHFKVVLVTGARQVGKTTLLKHVFPKHRLITFDPVQDLFGARSDPDFFLNSFPPPLILDEIQFVPELLAALKRRVDESEKPGQYLLTGSQNLSVLRTVSESLAGRVALLPLEGMTYLEMIGRTERGNWLSHYLHDPVKFVKKLRPAASTGTSVPDMLWRGSFPGTLDLSDDMIQDYFNSYLRTYVERDVRHIEGIRELTSFGRFVSLASALTAQEVNASHLGREVKCPRIPVGSGWICSQLRTSGLKFRPITAIR